MAKTKSFQSIHLILDNGGEIEIWYPENSYNFEEPYDEMRVCIENGQVWWIGNYDWEAKYKGNFLDQINCGKVVGWI